ncbi:MAG: hypothetical protein ACXVHX_23895 [Solirubrobacteraceae bacterium]
MLVTWPLRLLPPTWLACQKYWPGVVAQYPGKLKWAVYVHRPCARRRWCP